MLKTLLGAAFAAGAVWLVATATFPAGPYVDDRPYCSGLGTIPYTVGGVRVEPTLSPRCHSGPTPAGALAPSSAPAVATFLLVASLGILIGRQRRGGMPKLRMPG